MLANNVDPIQLGRDCIDFGGFKRREIWHDADLRVEQFAAMLERPITTFVDIAHGVAVMAHTEVGAVLVRSEVGAHWSFVPPQGITVTRGARRILLRFAKGAQAATIATWALGSTTALERNLNALLEAHRGQDNGIGLPARSTRPHFTAALDRLQRALANPNTDLAGALIRSVVAESISYVADDSTDSVLAPTPGELAPNLKSLVDEVRSHPRRSWPLKDAADLAEYSPFHFSRIFKQLVGFGFHEFVDRVRCELGIELLCRTEDSIEMVASMAGFSTTQGLRDALKEYIGLAPKDFRSEPHPSLIR